MNYEGIPNPPADAVSTLDIVVRLVQQPDGQIAHWVFYPDDVGQQMKIGLHAAMVRGDSFFQMACANLCAQLGDTLIHHSFDALKLKLALVRMEQQVPYLAEQPASRAIN
jgi:hypothetical protein